MFVCMNSESMLGGENSGEMLTIIMPFYLNSGISAVFGPGIPVEFQLELSGIPAVCRQQFQQNSGGMPAIVPVEFPPEFQWNAGNNSGGIPAGIPVLYRRNAGNNSGGMPAIIPAEFWLKFRWNTGGMPAIIRRSSGLKCPEFQGNTDGMPAIIPADSSGIPVESAWNLPGIPGKSGLELGRDSTGIPGLFLLGKSRRFIS